MNKLLFLVFALQITIMCFSGEKSVLFHYKKANETNKDCCSCAKLKYNTQDKEISGYFTSLSYCSKLSEALTYLAYYTNHEDIREVDWQVLEKKPSEKVESYVLSILGLNVLKAEVKQNKFDIFSFIKEEGGQPKYIVRTFAIPLNYFLSQPYLLKFTTKPCTLNSAIDSISSHHIIEATITKEHPTVRWHSEYIIAFLGISGLAAYGIYHKWFKK